MRCRYDDDFITEGTMSYMWFQWPNDNTSRAHVRMPIIPVTSQYTVRLIILPRSGCLDEPRRGNRA